MVFRWKIPGNGTRVHLKDGSLGWVVGSFRKPSLGWLSVGNFHKPSASFSGHTIPGEICGSKATRNASGWY
eukprot:139976-Rhodomonas_salina.2